MKFLVKTTKTPMLWEHNIGRKFDSSVRFLAETCEQCKRAEDYPKVWFTSQNGERKIRETPEYWKL